jgi:hypothetical protein
MRRRGYSQLVVVGKRKLSEFRPRDVGVTQTLAVSLLSPAEPRLSYAWDCTGIRGRVVEVKPAGCRDDRRVWWAVAAGGAYPLGRPKHRHSTWPLGPLERYEVGWCMVW